VLLESLYGKNKTVIDIGCGNGMFTKTIADKFESIASIDVNEKRIRNLRDYCAERGIRNISVEKMDAHALSYGDGRFDVAIFFRSVDHIPDYTLALAEAYRVLKRGGGIDVLVADTRSSSPAIEALWALRDFEDDLQDLLGVGEGMCEVKSVDIAALEVELVDAGFRDIREEVAESGEDMAKEYFLRIKGKSIELLAILEARDGRRYEEKLGECEGLLRRIEEDGIGLRPTVEFLGVK
jgi:cyclopropane fatty-acyl-phospholipid synthase-like methyltransferase